LPDKIKYISKTTDLIKPGINPMANTAADRWLPLLLLGLVVWFETEAKISEDGSQPIMSNLDEDVVDASEIEKKHVTPQLALSVLT
jgi:hypothetical protein